MALIINELAVRVVWSTTTFADDELVLPQNVNKVA
jgi:hypothetical protein